MQPKILEVVTIFLGALACGGAFIMSLYFARARSGIARAVAIDKLAESINMLVILTFAVCYYNGWFEKMPIMYAAALRLAAIAATLFSSLHLAIQTQRVLEE